MLGTWVVAAAPSLFAARCQYTWSLTLFAVPLAVGVRTLQRDRALAGSARALAITVGLLLPTGVLLTLVLADDFFAYPNASATLGWFVGDSRVPVEEFAFYLLGFATLVVAYLWLDHALLPMRRPAHRSINVSLPELMHGLFAGVALSAMGWALQRLFNPGAPMPGYWLYLMLVPVPVVVACGPAVAHRINWPALGIVSLGLWGHSILWEVTLGIPQGWWAYQPDAVIGLRIAAWHQLPLEAVVVWLLTPPAAVVTFEVVRAHLLDIHRRTP